MAFAVNTVLVGRTFDPVTGVGAEAVIGVTGPTGRAFDASAQGDAASISAVLSLGARIALTARARALAKGAQGTNRAEVGPLVEFAVTVVIDAITLLCRRFATHATGVEQALVYSPVTIVVREVTHLLLGAHIGATDDLPRCTAVEVATATLTRETRGALLGIDDGAAVGLSVDQVVTVVINPIAYLGVAIRDAQVAIAGIAHRVTVGIVLPAIDDLGTIVTGVTYAIPIFVCLIGVGQIGAVVGTGPNGGRGLRGSKDRRRRVCRGAGHLSR